MKSGRGQHRPTVEWLSAAGEELNEKILAWLFLSWMAKMFCRSLSLQQYAGNWIINSTLMESWEYWVCFFFSSLAQLRPATDGLNRRLLGILSASWWVRFVSVSHRPSRPLTFFLLPLSLPPSLHPSIHLNLPSVSLSLLSLCVSLTHAVSKQTVLSRSISGCHAVEEKNKIKNTERERHTHTHTER